MKTTSENMTYLVDNQKNMCEHNKLHPLPDRRGIWISETMYRYIKKYSASFREVHHFRGWRQFTKSEIE